MKEIPLCFCLTIHYSVDILINVYLFNYLQIFTLELIVKQGSIYSIYFVWLYHPIHAHCQPQMGNGREEPLTPPPSTHTHFLSSVLFFSHIENKYVSLTGPSSFFGQCKKRLQEVAVNQFSRQKATPPSFTTTPYGHGQIGFFPSPFFFHQNICQWLNLLHFPLSINIMKSRYCAKSYPDIASAL